MVEGESGILAISPPWERPRYEPSKRRLTWPNGAIATLFSADEPERLRGPQHDVGQIVRVIAELEWLREALELEAAIENDQSPQPARLQAIITELCDFLSALANEEIAEIPGNAETNGSPPAWALPGMLGTADAPDLQRVAAVLRKNRSNMPQLAGGIAKAKHSRGDQILLDMAHFARDQCLKFGGLSLRQRRLFGGFIGERVR